MSSSNIKSWADASSDEESDSEHPRIAPPPSGLPGSESYSALQQAEETEYYAADGDGGGGAGGGNLRVMEDLPANPPFTAYVGNVHRDILNSKDFWAELDGMLEDRGCAVEADGQVVPVKIVGTRLITDRNTGQTKGFGYVEFGTPEELLAFINLGNHQLLGRNLKVDVAAGEPRSGGGGGGGRGGGGGERRRNSHARGNRGEGGGGRYDRQYSDNGDGNYIRRDNRDDAPIDGTQFQGGRYARSSSSLSIGSGVVGGGSGSLRRNGNGMMKRTDSAASAGGGGLVVPNSPAKQRPSLKLAPRTKPLEDGNESASRSSIFGDAKPRDETKFEEKKAAAEAAATTDVTQIREEHIVESVTSSMGAMEVKEESSETKKGANENAEASDSKEEDKNTKEKSTEKQDDFTSISTKAWDRKTSRGTSSRGPSGRGGDRTKDKDSEDRNYKKDGRRDISGRRPFGRGEGRGGGRGDRPRNTDRGGRNNTREAGKRPSASTTKASNGDTAKVGGELVPTSSLSVAAAAVPLKKESKAPPKKANSFAAFMDESDDE
ncbi:hypothetical protein ACHAWX_003369 [Stephanocyclus meneghinianus]